MTYRHLTTAKAVVRDFKQAVADEPTFFENHSSMQLMDRVTTVAEVITIADSLTWSDAQRIAASDIGDSNLAAITANATRRLGWRQVEIIREGIIIAAETSASRDQREIVGFWVADDDPRAMLWRALRRATWEKAVGVTVAIGLAAAAGHPMLTRLPTQT